MKVQVPFHSIQFGRLCRATQHYVVRFAPAWRSLVTISIALGAWQLSWSAATVPREGHLQSESIMSTGYHGYAAVGLLTLLFREMSGLISNLTEFKYYQVHLWTLKEQCLPPLLLCLILVALTTVEAVFAVREQPWVHFMGTPGKPGVFQPVHTLRFAEWLVSVPLLLMLSGHCLLGRPVSEVKEPALITNWYIVISWGAMLTSNLAFRWILVVLTFLMFGWASHGMLRWVSDYKSTVPPDLPSRHLRPVSVGLLIGLFGVYGCVYIATITGIMGADLELFCYTWLGFAAKVAMSMLCCAIRTVEEQQMLASLLAWTGSLNTAFMSLLRGSFEVLVPCVVTDDGVCLVAETQFGDAAQLENMFGRQLKGTNLEDLLCDPEERQRFQGYVNNTLEQSESLKKLEPSDAKFKAMGESCTGAAPVAQVLHCKLAAADGAQVQAVMHLSAMRSPGCTGYRRHLVAAVRFLCVEPESSAQPVDSTVQPEVISGVQKVLRLRGKKKAKQRSRTSGSSTSQTASKGCESNAWTSDLSSSSDDGEQMLHGSDAGSQSSKLSQVGSVTAACRQLLGPLLERPPPHELQSKCIEDHVQCAAEMVRMKVPTEISRFNYQQKLSQWEEKTRNASVYSMFSKSPSPSSNVEEVVWRNEVLPNLLEKKPPGSKPRVPELPTEADLWYRAWKATYESDSGDEDDDDDLTFRTDPRIQGNSGAQQGGQIQNQQRGGRSLPLQQGRPLSGLPQARPPQRPQGHLRPQGPVRRQ